MFKNRPVPSNTTLFTNIDSLGNFVSNNYGYYMVTCPKCNSKNPEHAISSGKCYRCGYTLTKKDEKSEYILK